MFEQPKAVRNGVVDMVHTPGSFYGAEVPEIDAMVASTNTAEVTRKNGGTAMMDAAHQKRFNVKYLGWIDSGVGFNLFTVNPPKFRESDGVLDLVSDTEIEIKNSRTIMIRGFININNISSPLRIH